MGGLRREKVRCGKCKQERPAKHVASTILKDTRVRAYRCKDCYDWREVIGPVVRKWKP